jgi:hypothetical protein
VSDMLRILGAVTVLTAFIAVQRGSIEPRSALSLVLNLLGSGLLASLALIGRQWGFLLLEAAWAAVSLVGLRARLR